MKVPFLRRRRGTGPSVSFTVLPPPASQKGQEDDNGEGKVLDLPNKLVLGCRRGTQCALCICTHTPFDYVWASLGQFLSSVLFPSSFQTRADLCLSTPPTLVLKTV